MTFPFRLFCFCLFVGFHLCVSSIAQAEVKEHKLYRVVHVADGDTIKLDNGEVVRLLGIDAPELRDGPKLKKDLRKHGVSKKVELARGRQSSQYAKQLMENKKVRLEFDRRKRDQYQRVLAYVFLPNGIFVNAQMVSAGYAYVYMVKPELRYGPLFRQLYSEAKEKKRGLWVEGTGQTKHLKWFKSSSKNPYTNK